jgi:hypothetical protein
MLQWPHTVLTRPAEIGAALVSFGSLFLVLGIILFFDAALLALGNVLFTAGITLLIGPQKTFYFFARKQKLRGTLCFFAGMLLVFARWTFIGMLVEIFGFLNLFGCVCAAGIGEATSGVRGGRGGARRALLGGARPGLQGAAGGARARLGAASLGVSLAASGFYPVRLRRMRRRLCIR